MKIAKLSLHQDVDKSFIVHSEVFPFAPFHHHSEYELVLILTGKGKRMVGDNVDRFEENDLVFTGPFLPHRWMCDDDIACDARAFVIQFSYEFLGDKFFEVPENAALKHFLHESVRGYNFYGSTRQEIISILQKMMNSGHSERLYNLFAIFSIFSGTKEYRVLSSPASINSFMLKENEKMQKALEFILQNFHNKIQIEELLEITNMSYPSFYTHFLRNYKMSYKQYLLEVRINYACKLLKTKSYNVSEIAYNCGFGNLSNFNRQFRKIKKLTPSRYQKELFDVEPGEGFTI
ncbi:MAG TPA: AraC family transcriptional regulator [Bacteroidales bacterium]|jgi:AraC-like DNA-binding protein|nr:AraC family transcriptional regulator [Bacteroidales bacterium]